MTLIPPSLSDSICGEFKLENGYQAYQLIRFAEHDTILNKKDKTFVTNQVSNAEIDIVAIQKKENELRYKKINALLGRVCQTGKTSQTKMLQQNLTSFFCIRSADI